MKTCTVCRNVYPQDLHFCPADGASLVASSDRVFPLGEVVNGYRVVDRLATGGFGETFLVEHATTSRRAVMKVLYATDRNVFDRLKREFAFLSKLEEPAFAQVHEFGMAWDNRPFLVMELVQGQTLKDVLRVRGRLRVADALAVGLRLARGLGRLHDAGFIHRDIKPSNVMIPDGTGQATFDQAKLIEMISEYDAAKESDQRQAALMNVATLLEKLRGRLSPWYARFEKQLAIATSVIGVASGLVSVIAGMVKVAKGHP